MYQFDESGSSGLFRGTDFGNSPAKIVLASIKTGVYTMTVRRGSDEYF